MLVILFVMFTEFSLVQFLKAFDLNNIGKNAFYYCTNLSSITFETNCIIQNIGDYALFSYSNQTEHYKLHQNK